MARGLAKRNFKTAPKHDGPCAVEAEEPVVEAPPEPDVEESEHPYKKVPVPGEQITIQCVGCGNMRTKYVKDASMVSEADKRDMFNEHGSYNPPLCGFCHRARLRQKKAA